MDFLTSATSVLSLFLLALPGFILVKCKLLNTSHIGALVTVLLYVCQPFIMLNAFFTKTYESSLLADMGIILLIGFASQIIILLLSKALFLFDKNNKLRANAYTFASALGNVGFMGIPVISALMPDNSEAILYVSIFLVTFNILCWTVGIYILTGDKKYISIKKAFINPPIIALAIALPLFFCRVKMPEAILTPINFLAEMNSPLAMIILGMRFADIKLKEMVGGWGVYVCVLIKLIITPLLVYVCLLPFNLNDTVIKVSLILASMPSANMVLMMSEKYNGDTVSSAKAVMMTTVISIITIPIILLLL